MQRELYGYWRSSASYRVRIALNLKGLDYSNKPIHLVREGGQQLHADYVKLNPQKLVPTYRELEQGKEVISLGQSQAILAYLDQRYPDNSLLPSDPVKAAHCLSLAQVVACEIHPLNNLRVLNYLSTQFDVDNEQKVKWYKHWIYLGFDAIEAQLGSLLAEQSFTLGDRPGYLETFIVPQVYNAERFHCDLTNYGRIIDLTSRCLDLHAFKQAHPNNQIDACD